MLNRTTDTTFWGRLWHGCYFNETFFGDLLTFFVGCSFSPSANTVPLPFMLALQQPASHVHVQYLELIDMLQLHISIAVAIVSTTHLCPLALKHHLHKASRERNWPPPSLPLSIEKDIQCGDPPLKPGVGLQVTKYVVELAGLSMGGWPAMGLKDNAVPRVALMTLKCWAITGTWTGL